jgi:hypothetical protein
MSAIGTNGQYNARIHQAEGVVSVQADCTMVEAHAKIQERAKLLGLTLEATATEILGHRIWFR